MIKCIATDMDGTLLGNDKLISEENLKAIEIAKSKGVDVIIATGRSLNGAKYPLEKAGIKLPMIVMNGAQLYDEKGVLHFSINIPNEKVEQILGILKSHGLYFEFYSSLGQITLGLEKALQNYKDYLEKHGMIEKLDEVAEKLKHRFDTLQIRTLENFEEVFKDGKTEVYKFIIFSKDKNELVKVKEELSVIPELVISSSEHTNIEVNHQDAQKGNALEQYVKLKGYSLEETMAIGDSYNDLSMLKKAGFSVAMANADDAIKNEVDFVTDSNDKHGFAKAVYKALGINE